MTSTNAVRAHLQCQTAAWWLLGANAAAAPGSWWPGFARRERDSG